MGAGFALAMRDLEIRGAGNILGPEQSGHIAAVGYDLYCQMVTEAVAELKGETPEEPAEIKIELPLDANLPKDYVAREELRLEAYRRLASVTTPDEVADIETEWLDRYGPVPDEARSLLEVARLRAECVRTGVREVPVTKASGFSGPTYLARIWPIALSASRSVRLERLYKGAVYKPDIGQLQIPVKKAGAAAAEIVAALQELVA
jgi:transcription-repair coupling factor (superfamily II helicase)